jgi:CRISPR type IV-associated protein Csf3
MAQCLKIDLGAPVAASDPYIHLDSFVAYAAGVKSVGRDGLDELEDGGEPEYWRDEIPFETYEVGDEWVWATSSAGIAHPDGDGDIGEPKRWNTTRWRTHFDHDPEHQIKQTHVNTSSGEFKSYNAALPYSATDSLTFFFEGDAERTVDLIETHVPAVGKKRSQGFGRITDVQVTSAVGAVDSAIYHNGRVLRSLPAKFAPTVASGITYERRTVRPPYWHQANQAMAIAPFVDVPRENLADELDIGEEATA